MHGLCTSQYVGSHMDTEAGVPIQRFLAIIQGRVANTFINASSNPLTFISCEDGFLLCF